jgi:hypothetical protein
MAKRPRSIRGMVTREITKTVAVIRCYDDFNHVEREQTVSLNGTYRDDAQILDAVRRGNLLDMGMFALSVNSSEVKTELRALRMDLFMQYSEVIETE